MGGHHLPLIEDFAARRLLAVETWSVPGREAELNRRGDADTAGLAAATNTSVTAVSMPTTHHPREPQRTRHPHLALKNPRQRVQIGT